MYFATLVSVVSLRLLLKKENSGKKLEKTIASALSYNCFIRQIGKFLNP